MIGKLKVTSVEEPPCKHNTGVSVYCGHNFLEDAGRYTADIRIVCDHCLTPFVFLGLPLGLDLTGAAVSPDGTEGRFAIAPKGVPVPPITGVEGFTIRKT